VKLVRVTRLAFEALWLFALYVFTIPFDLMLRWVERGERKRRGRRRR